MIPSQVLLETRFFAGGELFAVVTLHAGDLTIFAGPDPDRARKIAAELLVMGDTGPVGFATDPETWLQLAPDELRGPYLSATTTAVK